jgi:hypothetical protein
MRAAELAQKLHQLVEFIPARESHIRPLLEKLDNDEDREQGIPYLSRFVGRRTVAVHRLAWHCEHRNR